MPKPSASAYAALGLPPEASLHDVKNAYRRLARKLHPDVNSAKDAGEQFEALNRAYRTILEEHQRANDPKLAALAVQLLASLAEDRVEAIADRWSSRGPLWRLGGELLRGAVGTLSGGLGDAVLPPKPPTPPPSEDRPARGPRKARP